MAQETLESTIFIETYRLKCFLEQNLLIQAHALVQKLSGICRDSFTEKVPEDNRFWVIYKGLERIKIYILGGKRDEAEKEAIVLLSVLKTFIKPIGEKPC